MDIIQDCQVHTLCCWVPDTELTIDGRYQYSTAPVQYTCRWEEEQVEHMGEGGTVFHTHVYLITEVLLEAGARVLRATLEDLTSLDAYQAGTEEVQKAAQTATLDGTETLYEAWA